MKESIITALEAIGFTIKESTDKHIFGEIHSFNNGGFDIKVDLRDQTFTVDLIHEFASTHLFLVQKFRDADYIVQLLVDSYPFQLWVLENDGSIEKMFREAAIANDL